MLKSKDFEKYSLELDDRGVLWVRHKSDISFELSDAIEQEKAILDFCENKPRPFIIDLRVKMWDATKEVREFHSTSTKLLEIRKSEAIILNNLGLRMLYNVYARINKPPNPVKSFTSEKEAIEWSLKQV